MLDNLRDPTNHDREELVSIGYLSLLIEPPTLSGLCIELKSPKGTSVIGGEQSACLKQREGNNFKCLISNDYDPVMYEVTEYMRGVRFLCKRCQKS